jgi:steroid delta-isomerase-like uncharacterized protein
MISGQERNAQEGVLEDFLRHMSSHDFERLLSLFTDDVVYEDVARRVVRHGKDQVRAAVEAFFMGVPDATFELASPGSRFAIGGRGSVEWMMRGTHRGNMPGMPATGKHVEARGASIVEIANDKICRCSDYFDRATLLEQLGFKS